MEIQFFKGIKNEESRVLMIKEDFIEENNNSGKE
jgi:hypothetical protein